MLLEMAVAVAAVGSNAFPQRLLGRKLGQRRLRLLLPLWMLMLRAVLLRRRSINTDDQQHAAVAVVASDDENLAAIRGTTPIP